MTLKGRRLGVKSLLLLITVLVLFALLISGVLNKRLDLYFYDTWMGMNSTPVSEQVVIVAIDDKSLAHLGRWPWSRHQHAEVIDKLTQSGVKSIGFDVIFSESESWQADNRFAQAIKNNGRVVLVLAPEKSGAGAAIKELLPLPDLAISAKGLGHVDIELDSDGRGRRVYLYGGLGDPHWPSLSLALARVTNPNISLFKDTEPVVTQGEGWIRSHPRLIPFFGAEHQFSHYSYVDVLQGRIGPEALKGKTVLIGATAVGLGDVLSTPMGRMSGVELNANIIEGLLRQKKVTNLGRGVGLLLTVLLALSVLLLAWSIPKKFYYTIWLPGLLMPLVCSYLLFSMGMYWFAPASSLLLQGLILVSLSGYRYQTSIQKIQDLNKQVYQQLNFDPLTHLPNKNMLIQQIGDAIYQANHQGERFALLVIQLGGIKAVNDRFGLQVGDQVLLTAAEQIQKAVSYQHPVAHLGGLEFSVLLCQQKDDEQVHYMASRLIPLLQQSYDVEGEDFYLTPCIGVSFYPDDGKETEVLMSNAYTAMHKAKRDKKCDLYFYSTQLKKQIVEASLLERDLRQALAQQQLEVYYQPQVMAGNGEIIGMEALLRWHHPERGFVSPADFIPIAERTGMIVSIGDWVLLQACQQAAYWRQEKQLDIRIAVNLSAIQFNEGGLVAKVSDALQQTRLPADLLELEITESALMKDLEDTNRTLKALKYLGVQIAIDDFGTGYSSLSYLQNFPLDRIKIDQSFVRDLTSNPETAEITLAIISMARGLKLKVIAEGVENPQQRQFLQRQACDELQGYFFSRPLPAKDVALLLEHKALGEEDK